MKIFMRCITSGKNRDLPYLNTITFLTKDKEEITFDREETWYGFDKKNGELWMEWRDVYIIDDDGENYDYDDDMLRDATLINLDVEEDAPEDYEIKCVECIANYNPIRISNYSHNK